MIEKIINKILSGRFIMVVVFSVTVSIGFLRKMVSPDAFLPIMILIVEWYFKREDRKGETNV